MSVVQERDKIFLYLSALVAWTVRGLKSMPVPQ